VYFKLISPWFSSQSSTSSSTPPATRPYLLNKYACYVMKTGPNVPCEEMPKNHMDLNLDFEAGARQGQQMSLLAAPLFINCGATCANLVVSAVAACLISDAVNTKFNGKTRFLNENTRVELLNCSKI
jgi:hypothetical protein